MTVTVVYCRYGGVHERHFTRLSAAAEWVEAQVERGELWGVAVLREGEALFDHEHTPSERRWAQRDPSTPWPGGHP